MEDNMEKALSRIFPIEEDVEEQPGPAPAPVGAPDATIGELIKKANGVFTAAQNAQREGNWAEYGNKLRELEDTLKLLNELTGEVPNSDTPAAQDN
jgi:uncharacterized membrane protein (UPF0182 family)